MVTPEKGGRIASGLLMSLLKFGQILQDPESSIALAKLQPETLVPGHLSNKKFPGYASQPTNFSSQKE